MHTRYNFQSDNSKYILHFVSLCPRITLIFVAVCISLCIIWVMYLSSQICVSSCRKVKSRVDTSELSIVKKAKIILEPTQNFLLLVACIAVTLSLALFVISSYEIGNGLTPLIRNSSRINCEPSSKGIIFSRMIYTGYSLVFASCFIRLLHILINLYIKTYNSNSVENQVKSHIAVMSIFACVALLGVTITYSTFYTCVAVWLSIFVQSFILCYKVYKFNRLLLKHQGDAIDLYQNINLRNELRHTRFEFFFLAIPICGICILAIFLFACTIALSSFYVTLAECSHLYSLFNTEVIKHVSYLYQVLFIIILEYMTLIINTTIALLFIFPVGLYTFYFFTKIISCIPEPKESTVPKDITQPLLDNHYCLDLNSH